MFPSNRAKDVENSSTVSLHSMWHVINEFSGTVHVQVKSFLNGSSTASLQPTACSVMEAGSLRVPALVWLGGSLLHGCLASLQLEPFWKTKLTLHLTYVCVKLSLNGSGSHYLKRYIHLYEGCAIRRNGCRSHTSKHIQIIAYVHLLSWELNPGCARFIGDRFPACT